MNPPFPLNTQDFLVGQPSTVLAHEKSQQIILFSGHVGKATLHTSVFLIQLIPHFLNPKGQT
jgi:hypothetical protein